MKKLKLKELNRISADLFKLKAKLPLCIVLDNIRSMYNVGSVFRIADAFVLEKIYLCGITGCPPHKELKKTALGSDEHVEWEYFSNTLDAISNLREDGYFGLAAEQTDVSTNLLDFKFDKNKKYFIVFGHEVEGVHEDVISLCDEIIEIPQGGVKHSLNISVSVGIIAWEFFKSTS